MRRWLNRIRILVTTVALVAVPSLASAGETHVTTFEQHVEMHSDSQRVELVTWAPPTWNDDGSMNPGFRQQQQSQSSDGDQSVWQQSTDSWFNTDDAAQ